MAELIEMAIKKNHIFRANLPVINGLEAVVNERMAALSGTKPLPEGLAQNAKE